MTSDPHLDAPLAALGALDGEDRAAFAAHLAGCSACRSDVAAHEETAARIGASVMRVPPAPALRDRVLSAAVGPAAVAPPRRRAGALFPMLATAAALVLGIGLLTTRSQRESAERQVEAARRELMSLQDEVKRARHELEELRARTSPDGSGATARVAALEAELSHAREELQSLRRQLESDARRARQTTDALTTDVQRARQDLAASREKLANERELNAVLAHPDARSALLQGLPAAPQARGRVVWNPGTQEAVLIASGLDPAPPGKGYEVWVIAETAPVPAGVFQVDPEGRVVIRLPVLADTARVKTFAITLEPAAGTPAPTGPMVLAGNAS
jgi:anti-sigma-K factor RskA